MKTARDPRHLKRIQTVKRLFSLSFQPPSKIGRKITSLPEISRNLKSIDQAITAAAPEWPLAQINRVDLAILRLAVYELSIARKEPQKVIIDEAIEIAKSYGSEKSSSFINGVLGTILKKQSKNIPTATNEPATTV